MSTIEEIKSQLKKNPQKWLITGVAGFIGSNLLEELLKLDQKVIGIDNFSTGSRKNLEDVKEEVGDEKWGLFAFYEGDIVNLKDCRRACEGVEFVLHQAALGSVPRSIDNPIATNQSNVDGFLNMLVAARDAGVKRFVFASSSSVYGDHPDLPKVEERIGCPLSPYAVSKYVNELYAKVFSCTYDMETVGLRYFNVFGKRQDPKGAYAAVIPKWIGSFLQGVRPTINGDGETSRDFCYIKNVIQANMISAMCDKKEAINKVYNVANGQRITLNDLLRLIKGSLVKYRPEIQNWEPIYGPFRKGDVRHSLADIKKAKEMLGYAPLFDVEKGMKEAIEWYVNKLRN